MNTVAKPRVRRNFKTVEAFEKWAYEQEFGYEFANKKVLKKEMIKEAELLIIWWLTEFFYKTKAHLEGGRLVSEVGMRLKTQNFRIPDLAYFSGEQFTNSGKGEPQIPQIAIEFYSKSESGDDILEKVKDYFSSGVKLVWYIFPNSETIYAYTSPKNVQILEGDDICSASPVIPDFQFQTKDIFKKDIGLKK